MSFITRTKSGLAGKAGLAGALAGGLMVTGVLVSTAAPAVKPTSPAAHPSLATLVAGSKKEDGKLVVYGNPSQTVMGPVIAAFQAAYPWVKVTHYDLDDNTIFSKYIAERSSSAPSADLLISSAPNLWIYASRKKLATDFTPRDIAAYPSFARQYKGIFVMSTDPAITIYNKLLLKNSSDVPTGIGDLAQRVKADPGTYGKLTAYTVDNNFGYAGYWAYVQKNGWSALNALAPSTRTTSSAGTMLQTVAQGGAVAAFLTSGAVRGAIASNKTIGDTVGWTYEKDLTPLVPRGIAITSGASRPFTAKLFVDWAFSTAGQQTLCEAGFTPYRNDFRPVNCQNSLQNLYDAVGKSHTYLVPFSQKYVNDKPKFSTIWHNTFK
jgi:iron(III) transport system substrate-binding protein